jgi:hypothetical protein
MVGIEERAHTVDFPRFDRDDQGAHDGFPRILT